MRLKEVAAASDRDDDARIVRVVSQLFAKARNVHVHGSRFHRMGIDMPDPGQPSQSVSYFPPLFTCLSHQNDFAVYLQQDLASQCQTTLPVLSCQQLCQPDQFGRSHFDDSIRLLSKVSNCS